MTRYRPAFTLLAAFIFFITNDSWAQKGRTYNFVTDFGARPDDKTDCYPAFVKAAAALSGTTGSTLIIPKGKYYVASYKIHGGSNKNKVEDVSFKNCNGLVIEGNNSIIRINGNFSRTPDYSIPGVSYKYAYSNTVCPIILSGCRNTLLRNITLYGEVDKMKSVGGIVEGVDYGICIYDGDKDTSLNVTIQNVITHHFAADGFLIRSNGRKLNIIDCKAYNNARQGLSIVKGKDILVYNSDFDSTGHTGGKYGFHWPAAGIDVENEFNEGDIDNVVIRKCQLRGNVGFQVESTLPSLNVLVDSCFIMDDEKGYGRGLNGVGLFSKNSTISNSIVFGTIQVDLADQGYLGPKMQYIKNNIIYSGHRGIICSDFNRPVNIDNNILVMLPKPEQTYFPYIITTNGTFNNNIVVMNPDRLGTGTPEVTSLVQNVKEGMNNFWLMNKNNFSEERRKGYHYYYAAFTNTKRLSKQFFPVNTFTQAMEIPEKRFVTDAQQEAIVNTALFSAFKQSSFNKLYLVQADAVRKYAAGIVAAAK